MAKIQMEIDKLDYERRCYTYQANWVNQIHRMPSTELCYVAGFALQELANRGLCNQEQVDVITKEVDRHLVITI